MKQAVIFEKRRDGTFWRHEMSCDHFLYISRMCHYGFTVANAIAVLDRDFACGVHRFSDGIKSTQIEMPKPQGFDPTVIFVDEVSFPAPTQERHG